MNSHVRINNDANYAALQRLDCSSYKVLMYLATRGDNVGRCYPAVETIAKDCNLHPQTVYKALDSLSTEGYICYLRKNAYDPVIGKRLPNVYMVSPYFMEIAPEKLVEAHNLWGSHFTKISYINQQQNHVPLTNSINQHHNQQQQPLKEDVPANFENSENANPKVSKPQTAKPQKTASAATTTQRSEKPLKSSAIVKKYTNPLSITEPLPDGLSELLAERLNGYGIPKPMARGFIHKYGYEHCSKSATYFEFVLHVQGDVKRPGGFFRSILEHGTADESLPQEMQLVNRDYSDYSEYLES